MSNIVWYNFLFNLVLTMILLIENDSSGIYKYKVSFFTWALYHMHSVLSNQGFSLLTFSQSGSFVVEPLSQNKLGTAVNETHNQNQHCGRKDWVSKTV